MIAFAQKLVLLYRISCGRSVGPSSSSRRSWSPGWTGYCTLGWRPITPRRVRVGVALEQGVPMEQQAFPTGGGEEAASVAGLPNA
jgi:hypothetical protein